MEFTFGRHPHVRVRNRDNLIEVEGRVVDGQKPSSRRSGKSDRMECKCVGLPVKAQFEITRVTFSVGVWELCWIVRL